MDFVADELFNGRRIRALTVVDIWSRECLAITVDQRLRGSDVVATMELLRLCGRQSERIQLDNVLATLSRAACRNTSPLARSTRAIRLPSASASPWASTVQSIPA